MPGAVRRFGAGSAIGRIVFAGPTRERGQGGGTAGLLRGKRVVWAFAWRLLSRRCPRE